MAPVCRCLFTRSLLLPVLLLALPLASWGLRVRPDFVPSAPQHSLKKAGASELNPFDFDFRNLSSHAGLSHWRSRKGGPLSASFLPALGFIYYHRGQVLTGSPIKIYFIYYGAWQQQAKALLEGFVLSAGGSSGGGGQSSVAGWWAIASRYFQRSGLFGAKQYVASQLSLAGTYSDAYSLGTGTLQDSDIQQIVASAISSKALPSDPSALYVVLTSSDVKVDGFCSSFCGYHSVAQGAGLKSSSPSFLYAFVGDASQCLQACAPQSNSPNGLPGIDAAISVLAHELAEAATDPYPGSGWLTFRGDENGDLCAWRYGKYAAAVNALGKQAFFNVAGQDGTKYLVQTLWDRSKQACLLQA